MPCDIICAVANQLVLYTVIFIAPMMVIVMIVRIFTAMGFTGIGVLTGFAISLIGLSFWGIIPWYITFLTIGISIYSLINKRRQINQ